MGFFERLEELRQKPEHHRRRILAVTLVFLMTLVIAFWLSTLRLERSADKTAERDESLRPWEVLKETFKAGKKELNAVLRAEVYRSME